MQVDDVQSKFRCATREAKMRAKVYPRRVAEGRMTQQQADYEMLMMLRIAGDYGKLLDEAEPKLEL